MMSAWKQYIFSLIACSLGCAIVSQIVADTKKKALIRLICGVILGVTILQPLTKINSRDLMDIPDLNQYSADFFITEGEKIALEEQSKRIAASCEAYILDKAKSLGAEIVVQIFLNEELIPVLAEIRGETDPNVQIELQKILTMDLGIPKENQKWIWNQESNSS